MCIRDRVRIDATGKWIEESDLQFALNESDAYALEEALQLKEKHGGEVIVVSAGPERVGTTIREALAKGADRAIQIACDDLGTRDALGAVSYTHLDVYKRQAMGTADCWAASGEPVWFALAGLFHTVVASLELGRF